MKFKSLALKAVGILIILYSLYYIFLDYESTSQIIIGTLIMVVGAVVYIMSSPESYNSLVSSTKKVANPNNISIEELYDAFKDMDSTLGKPWLGKVKTIRGKCMIFGPGQGGEFLYIHKLLGSFYLAVNDIPTFFNSPENQPYIENVKSRYSDMKLFSNKHAICYSLLYQTMVDDLQPILEAYVQENKILPLPNDKNLGKLYRFDEDFKITGQKFTLYDFDERPMYQIEATIPLLNFYVREELSGKEVFHMQKKILKLMSTYEFFVKGEAYGTFKQKVDVMHDTFEMDTADGKLFMQSINDKLGVNYIVKMNDVVIGSIAERFNLTVHNIFFDNFILHVRDDKYTALLAGLAVMAARELSRDTAGSIL